MYNESFLEISEYLKSIGVKNYNFMNQTIDKDLIDVDPYDSNLTLEQKEKIIGECSINIWYYLRNVVRTFKDGGENVPFKLDKVNCAQFWLAIQSFNTWVSKSRELRKTIDTLTLINWIRFSNKISYQNAGVTFYSKTKLDARLNKEKLDKLALLLPDYFQKFLDPKLACPINIPSFIGASSNTNYAESIGRSINTAITYFSEAEFIKNIDIIYQSMLPLYSRIYSNSLRDGNISCLLFESVYSDDEYGRNIIEKSVEWDDQMYDYSKEDLNKLFENGKYRIFHIRKTYQELGYGETYFDIMCKLLNNDEDIIRREVLLERKSEM